MARPGASTSRWAASSCRISRCTRILAGSTCSILTSPYGENVDANVTLVGREYTKIGPSFAAEFGKEFAISPYWGLGVAAHYELLSVPPGDDHSKATIDFAQQLSLRFVATFGDR